MASSKSWQRIFDYYDINKHDFDKSPFEISAPEIKKACQNFTKTSEKEVRILCKQDTREQRPHVFIKNGLFILPIKNGKYKIIRGEGYVDLPPTDGDVTDYVSKITFPLDTSTVGNSEMQHLDYAYASSMIRTFVNDDSLVLTIRGRKYTPEFQFNIGVHTIVTKSVQTEVDAGYEGKDRVVLIEAKNSKATNTIIRQLYYPYRQWQEHTKKEVLTLFFEKEKDNQYHLSLFEFTDVMDYNSITLVDTKTYRLT
ncbi:MAG: hypothetical protein WCN86_03600 [bacterium]